MSDAGYVTPHRPGCPAIGDEDRTCPCWRTYIPELPRVNEGHLLEDFGEATVGALRQAGRLLEHPKLGLVLTPESLT